MPAGLRPKQIERVRAEAATCHPLPVGTLTPQGYKALPLHRH